jgi:cyclin-dependent kinase 7
LSPPPMPFDSYEREGLLGEGTFGKVYRCRERATGRKVAVKRLYKSQSSKEGAELPMLREIMLLHELKHDNVIDLAEVYAHDGSIHLVFEFCSTDLEAIINDKSTRLDASRIKGYMQQTLRGVAAIHASWVLHRDLKPGNLFVSPAGVVKVGDFGLARFYGSPDRRFTGQVVTRWYRAPELLFGAKFYGTAIDMWSLGCIFAELLLRVPYLAGTHDLDQLQRIFTALGTPTEENWPGVSALPYYVSFPEVSETPMRQLFTAASDDALEMLKAMLKLCPGDRIAAEDALAHVYFSSSPAPATAAELAPQPKDAST